VKSKLTQKYILTYTTILKQVVITKFKIALPFWTCTALCAQTQNKKLLKSVAKQRF